MWELIWFVGTVTFLLLWRTQKEQGGSSPNDVADYLGGWGKKIGSVITDVERDLGDKSGPS